MKAEGLVAKANMVARGVLAGKTNGVAFAIGALSSVIALLTRR